MSAFTSTGTIVVVMDKKQISATFQKREFVIEIPSDNPDFKPSTVVFEVANDKCDVLDSFQVGQEVEVSWNLKGRSWDKKDGSPMRYFNTLQCWRINAKSQQQADSASREAMASGAYPVETPQFNEELSEDVPF